MSSSLHVNGHPEGANGVNAGGASEVAWASIVVVRLIDRAIRKGNVVWDVEWSNGTTSKIDERDLPESAKELFDAFYAEPIRAIKSPLPAPSSSSSSSVQASSAVTDADANSLEPTAEQAAAGITPAILAQSRAGGLYELCTLVTLKLLGVLVAFTVFGGALVHLAILSARYPLWISVIERDAPGFAPLVHLVSAVFHAEPTVTRHLVYLSFAFYMIAGYVVRITFFTARQQPRPHSVTALAIGHAVLTAAFTFVLYRTHMLELSLVSSVLAYLDYLAHATLAFTLAALTLDCDRFAPIHRWQYTHVAIVSFAITRASFFVPLVRCAVASLFALPATVSTPDDVALFMSDAVVQAAALVLTLLPVSMASAVPLPAIAAGVAALTHSVASFQVGVRVALLLVESLALVSAIEGVKALALFALYEYAPVWVTGALTLVFLALSSFVPLMMWLAAGSGATWVEMVVLVLVAWATVKNLVKTNEEVRWKGFGTPEKKKMD